MITLNLVPAEDKKEIKMLNLYLSIKNFVYIILIGTIILAVSLLIAKFILQNNFSKIVGEHYINFNLNRVLSLEIKTFNTELNLVLDIQKEYIPWSNFFFRFNEMVTDGIVINTMTAENNGTVFINGFAKNRDTLLAFKDKLDASGLFDEFEIPLSTLLTKQDIRFTLELTFDTDKIKNDSDSRLEVKK